MIKKINIAVDGTASSGKSSIMSQVAKELGFDFIDTGLMYRAFTKYCLNNNIDFLNQQEIIDILKSFSCEYKENGQIYVNNQNYTQFLQDYDVAENIKYIAQIKEVREYMVENQKKLAEEKNKIMVGRDITTVVLPEAEFKIYFDCSVEARAKRRYNQNLKNNISPNDYEDILRQIEQRDLYDKNREHGALKIVADAWVFDTSDYNLEECIKIVIKKIKSIL